MPAVYRFLWQPGRELSNKLAYTAEDYECFCNIFDEFPTAHGRIERGYFRTWQDHSSSHSPPREVIAYLPLGGPWVPGDEGGAMVSLGLASCHFIPVRDKKAQPFRAGLRFVVGDVQAPVAIGSHRLHQQFTEAPDPRRDPRFHRRRDAQGLVNSAEVVPSEVQAVRGPQVFPLLTERIRQAREAAHTHADRQVRALDVRGTDLRWIGIAHDWDSLRVRDIGRAVPALAFRVLRIYLDELREVATVAQGGCNRAHVGLESIGSDLEVLGAGRVTQSFDEGIRRGLAAAPQGEVRLWRTLPRRTPVGFSSPRQQKKGGASRCINAQIAHYPQQGIRTGQRPTNAHATVDRLHIT